MAAVLLLALVALSAAAERPFVVSQYAQRKTIDVGPGDSITGYIFSVEFNEPMFFNAERLDRVSADEASSPGFCLGFQDCQCLPSRSSALMGSVQLSCPSANVTLESLPLDTCANPLSVPPTYVIPLPPTEDPYRSFLADIGLVPDISIDSSSTKFSAFVLDDVSISGDDYGVFYDDRRGVDLTTCQVELVGDWTNLMGEPLSNTSQSVTGFSMREGSCRFAALNRVVEEITSAIGVIGQARTLSDLNHARYAVSALASLDAFQDCVDFGLEKLEGAIADSESLTTACFLERGTPEYEADPCCNALLRFEQCCAPQLVQVPLANYEGTTEGAIETCRDPDNSESLLLDLVQSLNRAVSPEEGCIAARQELASDELFAELRQFILTCDAVLNGDESSFTASCVTDDDCYTFCLNGRCAEPWNEDSVDPYVDCYLDQMSPTLEVFLRDRWGLAVNAPIEEFTAAFVDNLFDPNCYGILAESLTFDESGNYIQASRAECLDLRFCNWTPEQRGAGNECNKRSTDFCGICESISCIDLTEQRGCSIDVTEAVCNNQPNTVWVPWKTSFNCYLTDVDSKDECLPVDVCPEDPLFDGTDVYCAFGGSLLCYDPALTEETCNTTTITDNFCEAFNNGTVGTVYVWDQGLASGAGLCRALVSTFTECADVGGEAVPPRIWSDGYFDTEEKCDAGACVLGQLVYRDLDVSIVPNCTVIEGCTTFCESCRSQFFVNLCFDPAPVSECECVANGGVFDDDEARCLYNLGRTSCTEAGHTYMSCSDLSLDECAACRDDPEGCPIEQDYLQCNIFVSDVCETADECEAYARCSDLPHIRTINTDTLTGCASGGFRPEPACDLGCVTPYSFDILGRPFCPDYAGGNAGNVLYSFGIAQGCLFPYLGENGIELFGVPSCQDLNGTIYRRAYDEETCLGHGSGCRETDGSFSAKGTDECTECQGDPGSFYTWTHSKFLRAGRFDRTTWQSPKYEPVNSFGPTLNLTKVNINIDAALSSKFSLAYKTEALCRYQGLADSLRLLTCDCSGDDDTASNCYSDGFRVISVGVQRFCSGLTDLIQLSGFQVAITPSSIPLSENCMSVEMTTTSALQFRISQDEALSNEQLTGAANSESQNPFAVIEFNGRKVGQLVADGIAFSFTFDGTLADVGLCFAKRADISIDTKFFTVPDFVATTDFETWNILELNVTVDDADNFCGVASVSSGVTYFAIQRDADFRDARDSDPDYTFLYLVAALDLSLALFAFSQVLTIVLSSGCGITVPLATKVVIMVFNLLRSAYLLLVSQDLLDEDDVWLLYILYDLPTYLFFTCTGLLVLNWAELSRADPTIRAVSFLGHMKRVFIGTNSILYLFFAAAGVIYDFTRDDVIVLVYRCFVAFVALVISAGFLFYGSKLLRSMKQLGVSSMSERQRKLIRRLTGVTAVCSLGLLAQTLFLVSSTFLDLFENINLQLVPFVVAEAMPCALLLFTMSARPKNVNSATRRSSNFNSGGGAWSRFKSRAGFSRGESQTELTRTSSGGGGSHSIKSPNEEMMGI